MRLRAILTAILVLTVLVGTAWALEVTFGKKTRAKATVVVDELGTILFGAVPAPVEVTNFPAATNCDCGGAATSIDAAPIEISTESLTSMLMGDAMLHCEGLVENGESDWRLPTFEQLQFAASGGLALPDARTTNRIWSTSRSYIGGSDYDTLVFVSGGFQSISLATACYTRCIR
jgi:hypothetical protein